MLLFREFQVPKKLRDTILIEHRMQKWRTPQSDGMERGSPDTKALSRSPNLARDFTFETLPVFQMKDIPRVAPGRAHPKVFCLGYCINLVKESLSFSLSLIFNCADTYP